MTNGITEAVKLSSALGTGAATNFVTGIEPIVSGVIAMTLVIFADRVLLPAVKYLIDKIFKSKKEKDNVKSSKSKKS